MKATAAQTETVTVTPSLTFAEAPQRGDGLAHLLDVGAATIAAGEVGVERGEAGRIEGSLEVVGDQLDELAAAQL